MSKKAQGSGARKVDSAIQRIVTSSNSFETYSVTVKTQIKVQYFQVHDTFY